MYLQLNVVFRVVLVSWMLQDRVPTRCVGFLFLSSVFEALFTNYPVIAILVFTVCVLG
jgi:hypothetical protein